MKSQSVFQKLFFGAGGLLVVICLVIDPIRGKDWSFGYIKGLLLAVAVLFALAGIFVKPTLRFLGDFLSPLIDWWQNRDSFGRFLRNLITKQSLISFLTVMGLFILITGLNQKFNIKIITEYQDYVGATIPISMLQVVLALAVLLILILPVLYAEKKNKGWIFDLLFCLAVFAVASYFWTKPAIQTNNFTRFVTGQDVFYPFSDSRKYDMNALAFVQGQGLGYGTPLQHPFYTFFVGILHATLGQDYPAIFRAHAVVYACFPVVLYFIGKNLGSRPMGILAAFLVVCHEYNLILYGSTYTLVNAQMMVSESFITLLFGLLMWLTFKWIDKPGQIGGPLVSGAVLGLAALVRTQALILLGVYLVYFILRWLGNKRVSFKPFLLLVGGLLIVLLPWMTRNWVKSGSFAMEDMRYVTNILTVNGTANRTTEASIIQYNENHQVDLIKSFTGAAGARYFRRVGVFFLHSTVHTLYQLPFSLKIEGIANTLAHSPGQYPIPFLHMTRGQWIAALVQMFLISLGAAALFKKFRLAGLLPLGMFFFYNFSSAIMGYAGFRFVQPVEWVFLFYWSAGVAALIAALLHIPFSQVQESTSEEATSKALRWKPALVFAVFCGLLLPVSEALVPAYNYPTVSSQSLQKNGVDEQSLQNAGFSELSGQALYPIVYRYAEQYIKLRNENYATYPAYYAQHLEWDEAFAQKELSKNVPVLIFQLGNDKMHDVILTDPVVTTDVEKPYNFHGQDVVVLGCDKGDHIEAYQIYFPGSERFIQSSEKIPLSCEAK